MSANATNFSDLLPPSWEKHVQFWLEDDIPSFDVGGFVVGDKQEECWLLGKSKGILAGVPFFNAVFARLGCEVEWLMQEGDMVDPASTPGGKVVVAKVRGTVQRLLQGERTALNIITRASGIATEARSVVSLVRGHGWGGHVAGTRKTTPGFRMVEKYALLVGGASTHRHDLSQMVMLKDNHVWSTGSITAAVHKALRAAGFSQKVEVEARSLDEAVEAAEAGAHIVMLDNMSGTVLRRAAAELKQRYPHVLIEASGGITRETICDYICPDVDIVSMGKLTQGYSCLDFSLKVQRTSSNNSGDSRGVAPRSRL